MYFPSLLFLFLFGKTETSSWYLPSAFRQEKKIIPNNFPKIFIFAVCHHKKNSLCLSTQGKIY